MNTMPFSGVLVRKTIRVALLATISGLSLSPMQAAAQSAEAVAKRFDIPAQSLAIALQRFMQQSGIQLSYPSDLADGRTSSAVSGNMASAEALSRLLTATGLTYKFVTPTAVTLERAPGSADGAIQLGPVRVEGTNGRDASASISSDPFASEGTRSYTVQATGTATRLPLSLRETPQSVGIVTRQRMNDQNLLSLDDTLAQSTGITTQWSGMTDGKPSFFSRGFEISAYQYDGVASDQYKYAIGSPDMAIYDRLEILRGPAGLVSGSGSPGATINLVRKRPLLERRLAFAAYAGSWNDFRGEVDMSTPIDANGTLRVRFVGVVGDSDKFYDVAKEGKRLAYGVIEWDVAPSTTLTAGVLRQITKTTPQLRGLPRYADGRSLGLPRSTFINTDWTRWNYRTTDIFTELKHRFENGWEIRLTGNYEKSEGDLLFASVYGGVDPLTNTGANLVISDFNAIQDYGAVQKGIDIYATGPFSLFGRSHELVVGVNARRGTTAFDGAGVTEAGTFPVDIFNFDPHGYPRPQALPYNWSTRSRDQQWGAYATARLNPADPLKIIVGGRISSWEASPFFLRDGDYAGFDPSYKVNGQFTPYAGIIVDLSSRWSLYASYADIFQVQSNYDRTGKILSPLRGSNYEAGIKGEVLGNLNLSFAVFRIDQVNRAQEDPDYPAPCDASPIGDACYNAGGQARSQGVEFEASGQITTDWEIFAGYTFNKTKYRRDIGPDGLPSPDQGTPFNTFTPKHILRLFSTYRLPHGFSVGGGISYQSGHYRVVNVAGEPMKISQKGYALTQVRLGYERGSLAVSLNVDNLFDVNYYANIGNVTWANQYGEPRSFMGVVRYSF